MSLLVKPDADIASMRTVFKEVFSHTNGLGDSFLDKLSVTKESDESLMKHVNNSIIALLGTGLFTAAKVIDVQSKIKDPVLQRIMVRSWATSTTPPTKEACIELMNAFAKEKSYLVAEIMLCRSTDFPFMSMAQFLIDNIRTPLSMDFYGLLSGNIEEFKARK